MRARIREHWVECSIRRVSRRTLHRAATMDIRIAALALALLSLSACSRDEPYQWQLPPGFPEPRVPEDNPLTRHKVELGRRLFYDERLSANGTQSCASCHQQAHAFAEAAATATGSTG